MKISANSAHVFSAKSAHVKTKILWERKQRIFFWKLLIRFNRDAPNSLRKKCEILMTSKRCAVFATEKDAPIFAENHKISKISKISKNLLPKNYLVHKGPEFGASKMRRIRIFRWDAKLDFGFPNSAHLFVRSFFQKNKKDWRKKMREI